VGTTPEASATDAVGEDDDDVCTTVAAAATAAADDDDNDDDDDETSMKSKWNVASSSFLRAS